MQKKLTITVDEEVYEGLHETIGPRKISKFIQELVRPYVVRPNLESAYSEMAKDAKREKEAVEWAREREQGHGRSAGDREQGKAFPTSRHPFPEGHAQGRGGHQDSAGYSLGGCPRSVISSRRREILVA